MNELIIVMGGSFNPPTIAHQRLLLAALDQLNADKGIFVPSSNGYVKTKMKRAKHPEETLTESCSMKHGKYIQYSRIFYTFARVKISRRISLPHYAVMP